MLDGATEHAAEDIAVEHRSLDAGRLQEGVVRVEGVVTEVFIKGAMKNVRAASRYRLHAAARAAPESCIIKRGLNLELLNGLGRGHSQPQHIVLVQAVGIDAVDL